MVRKNIPLSMTVITMALLGGTTFVFASAIQANHETFDALFGTYSNSTKTLNAVDQGFNTATQSLSARGISQGSQVNFSSAVGIATNGVTAGDWVITVRVNTTASTTTNTGFIVDLKFNEVGASAQHFTLYIGTGTSVSPNNEILCMFDVGSNLFSPYSYIFSIQ